MGYRVSWEQSILTALLTALVTATATAFAARRAAGATLEAAKEAAQAARDAANELANAARDAAEETAGATKEASEIARHGAFERDEREARRGRLRSLLDRAARRETIWRSVANKVEWSNFRDAVTDLDTLNESLALEPGDRYVGMDNEQFHMLVETYWSAEQKLIDTLSVVKALGQLASLPPDEKYLELNDGTREWIGDNLAWRGRNLLNGVKELNTAVLALHHAAPAYISDTS
jgi:hypothetical protein